ncbi:hypothetical protein SEPCBS57363_005980 [Sporothrix epigloea]|uniref:Uncharacterized protein n=1 Tax=Sporothrix epigloea TaxID=1892477 RepID=A0ABP0E0J4_9PEZI
MDKMEPDLAQDFETYANTLLAEDGEVPRLSWRNFTHWFDNVASDKTEVRFAATRDFGNSYQAADQSPRVFAGELAFYERLMSPLPDDYRADSFRCRLVQWLKDELYRVENVNLLSRDALVNKAEAIWQSRTSTSKDKRKALPVPSSSHSTKRQRTSDRDGVSSAHIRGQLHGHGHKPSGSCSRRQ